jgi:hypothetical protein
MAMGLFLLVFRRELFSGPHRITTEKLRGYPRMWAGGSFWAFPAVASAVDLVLHGGNPLTAASLAVGGLSWLGVTLVFFFSAASKRQDALAGALLSLCGTTVAELGLQMSGSRHLLVLGSLIIATGVALAGAGFSLLDSTGALARARRWLAYLVTP